MKRSQLGMMTSVNYRSLFIISIGALILIQGCERRDEPEEYIARIGNEYLTIDMVRDQLDETIGWSDVHAMEYINHWINTEILYQEARRRGIDRDERVLKPLYEIRRNLAINALLDDEVYRYDYIDVRDEDIEEYYNENIEKFTAEEAHVHISYILFDERNVAASFRNSVIGGTDWEIALEEILIDPDLSGSVVEIGERTYYRESDIYPGLLWRAARQLRPDGVSTPIQTDNGYYILTHHESIPAGGSLPIEFIANEIRERLVIKMRHENYREFIKDLRTRYPVEVRLEYKDGVFEPGRH